MIAKIPDFGRNVPFETLLICENALFVRTDVIKLCLNKSGCWYKFA